MWVPVPQDWNKACQLIPGLPAQEPCSNPLPRAALCSQSTVCPFGCPRSLGGIETSWRHRPRQYCQAKLETKEAQLQVERGRCGAGGLGRQLPTSCSSLVCWHLSSGNWWAPAPEVRPQRLSVCWKSYLMTRGRRTEAPSHRHYPEFFSSTG